ncbi:phospholipase A2 [Sigmodon hispidus]
MLAAGIRTLNPGTTKALDECCQTRDYCYAQVYNLKNCIFHINSPYITSYLYSCSGNEITCSDTNKPCEAFICNCDHEAAICFSKTSYNKEYKGCGI